MTAISNLHGQVQAMPRKLDEGSVQQPSSLMIERGKAFGAWFRKGVQQSGKNIKVLSELIGVSRQMLYAFRDDCIGSDGRYRKPSESMVIKIANGLNISASDGLRSMGYNPEGTSIVPSVISDLPPESQYALAEAIKVIRQAEIQRIREKPEDYEDVDPEFVTAYLGSTPSGREQALKILQKSRQRERQESIGGGVPPSERLDES